MKANETGEVSMEIKVSVIIPVFNPGDRFKKCVSSLMEQSLKEIELLFVDDACTDGSIEHIRMCALKDPRIRVITNPQNIGPGQSRNRGIEEARGEFLSFVDADDYVPADFLENLYLTAVESGADIAKGLHCCVGPCGEESIQNSVIQNSRILKKELPLYFAFNTEHQAAIYNREMVMSNQIRYGTSCNSEDSFFLLQVCYAAGRIQLTDKAVYYYVERNGSRFRDLSLKRIEGEIVSLKEMMSFMASHDLHSWEALKYIAFQGVTALGFINLMKEQTELSADLIKLQEKIWSLLTQYPWAEQLKQTNLIIDAFLTDGCNLAFVNDDIRKVPLAFLYRNAEDLIQYLCSHPSKMNSGAYFLNCAIKRVAISDSSGAEKEKRLHSLRSQAAQLRIRPSDFKNSLKLRVFILTGLNIYRLEKTWPGRRCSQIRKKAREKKS